MRQAAPPAGPEDPSSRPRPKAASAPLEDGAAARDGSTTPAAFFHDWVDMPTEASPEVPLHAGAAPPHLPPAMEAWPAEPDLLPAQPEPLEPFPPEDMTQADIAWILENWDTIMERANEAFAHADEVVHLPWQRTDEPRGRRGG